MRVILRENVEHLGQIGDVVKVSSGYARNFLLPNKLVVLANEGQLKEIEHHKRILEKKRISALKDSQELADRLSALKVTIAKKVGAKDRLYGSVTAQDIHEQIESNGFKVDRHRIQLKEPLKALGEHQVTVKIQPGVQAEIKVEIVKSEE